jgi:O-acetylhomoserine/O-acetylserine sulfhydrylase-like pyridoxal-dependent enzyme
MARAARKEPTVRELDERLAKVESRLAAIEGSGGLDGVRQAITEAQSSNDALFKVVLRQIEDMRTVVDRRFDAVMAQFEKLQAKPTEN